jgi:hypothetical protein
MEHLIKETLTLHKVLSKYLGSQAVEVRLRDFNPWFLFIGFILLMPQGLFSTNTLFWAMLLVCDVAGVCSD